MTIIDVIKNLEKYNTSANFLGLEEKKARIYFYTTKIEVASLKELKKCMKKEYTQEAIELYSNTELTQDTNSFSGEVNSDKILVTIY